LSGWKPPSQRLDVGAEVRVGGGNRADVDFGEFGIQAGVHCVDEFVGKQGVSGVRGMEAVEAEQSAKECCGGVIAVNGSAVLHEAASNVLTSTRTPPTAATCCAMAALY